MNTGKCKKFSTFSTQKYLFKKNLMDFVKYFKILITLNQLTIRLTLKRCGKDGVEM